MSYFATETYILNLLATSEGTTLENYLYCHMKLFRKRVGLISSGTLIDLAFEQRAKCSSGLNLELQSRSDFSTCFLSERRRVRRIGFHIVIQRPPFHRTSLLTPQLILCCEVELPQHAAVNSLIHALMKLHYTSSRQNLTVKTHQATF